MTEPGQVSEQVDLTGLRLGDLLKDKRLGRAMDKVVAQVEKPRNNLGGAGPPGRAD